jgi:DNA-binding Lrp family transcriptional regulator
MGGREPMVDDEEILDILRASSIPVMGTSDVAEKLPIGREGTLKRLLQLEESGAVESHKIGNVLVWWVAED